MLEKGENRAVNRILKYVSGEDLVNIDNFVLNGLLKDYSKYNSDIEISANFYIPGYITYDQATVIRSFTGTNYFDINSALRGRWSYQENGTNNRKEDFLMIGTKIKSLISTNSVSYGNFITYRGVGISYFSDYGIKELVDLKNLEGKFMYDAGFVSTSLLPQQSFFGKDIEKGKNYNIMIEYMVPQDFTDGIYIGNNASFSYHPHEQEYLINAGNISRVTSVKVNEDDTAKICAIVIPKFLYDDYYKGKESKSK